MSEQARQRPSRIAVIFDEQDAQRLRRLLKTLGTHSVLFGAIRDSVKRHLKGRTVTSATALDCDRAAVKIDKMFRNRQTQPEPTKLTSDGRIRLLEWREERSLPLDFDSDSIIDDLKLKMTTVVIRSVDIDLSARWGELDGLSRIPAAWPLRP